ncbi:hypothetical protein A5787_19890 [Mycobacterium sp. 852002-50816_SCH5313054-b]|uniref:hypothetical protein n=1 Tax=Mycobacterium sp. 852002-50816_SCH5313054-b TaxID=1834092 RepID=UPI0008004FBB|nr:hypothetical protein [Mycobacterium sp. 852002-50816_SCH5313054-b]OBF60366.1 hypothetical protein A5787_19890 [Mycobacterium sp. 852002-50816_SCH5313054-b]
MAERLDVAERLAEGRPAVEHTQTYVRACHALGYRYPEMTSHPLRIREWYDSEEGLDLRALHRDCTELRAAGAAVAEALRLQRAQLADLAAAWAGPGGESAVRFLERHCDAASAVATEVRAAAQRCESLRDNLWYLVDSKVAAAIAIDDRTRAQQPGWLAAAAAITTGVGDRAGAEDVVREQIQPYVDNEIHDDWLTTMRSTVEGVDTSYDMVIDRMAAAPPARFEVPSDLGPGYQPRAASPPGPSAVVASAPFPGRPADPVPGPPPAMPSPTAAIPAPPLPDLGTASAMPAGDVGGGLSGLGGLANRIVEAMGSLLGSAVDPADTADAFGDEDPFHPDDAEDAEDKPDEPDEVKDADKVTDTAAAKPAEEAIPVAAPAAPVAEPPAPVADPAAPVAEPPAPVADPAPPATEASTPCEIAADQLPQAGR